MFDRRLELSESGTYYYQCRYLDILVAGDSVVEARPAYLRSKQRDTITDQF